MNMVINLQVLLNSGNFLSGQAAVNFQRKASLRGITVELGYNNIGYCDTLPIASNTQWYKIIPRKATVFIPRLVRHSQMHQPRV
jgi:hypothetical protein